MGYYRTTSPVHIPTANNMSSTSTQLTETSHSTVDGHLEAAIGSPSYQPHMSSPSHQVHMSYPSGHDAFPSSPSHKVHMSSPSHQVHVNGLAHQVIAQEALASSPSHQVHITSSSHHSPTPTDSVEVISSTDSSTGSVESSSSDEEQEEQPFSWENLSEVEDEPTAAAMTEPPQCDYDPVQFSVPISSHLHTSPPSLQDAFRQHKAGFISSSQSRLQQIKEKRKEQVVTSSALKQSVTPTKPPSTSRVVQFSSPLFTSQDTGEFTPPTIHRTNCKYT